MSLEFRFNEHHPITKIGISCQIYYPFVILLKFPRF